MNTSFQDQSLKTFLSIFYHQTYNKELKAKDKDSYLFYQIFLIIKSLTILFLLFHTIFYHPLITLTIFSFYHILNMMFNKLAFFSLDLNFFQRIYISTQNANLTKLILSSKITFIFSNNQIIMIVFKILTKVLKILNQMLRIILKILLKKSH